MRTGSRGFSLVELLIVMAFIGIIVVLGVGGVRALLDRGRLSEAVSTLTAEIEQGRRVAKRTDADVAVVVAQVDGEWTVSSDGVVRRLGAGVVVTPAGTTTIALNAPFGTYAGADVDLQLNVGAVARSLTVTGVLARVVER